MYFRNNSQTIPHDWTLSKVKSIVTELRVTQISKPLVAGETIGAVRSQLTEVSAAPRRPSFVAMRGLFSLMLLRSAMEFFMYIPETLISYVSVYLRSGNRGVAE